MMSKNIRNYFFKNIANSLGKFSFTSLEKTPKQTKPEKKKRVPEEKQKLY